MSAPARVVDATGRERVGRAEISELIADARQCHRQSEWERGFVSSLVDQVREFGISASLSQKQIVIFRRIQEKVYAT